MADKSISFLFSGIHFDRKKFSTDFDRFKKETETSPENEKSVTTELEEGTSVNGKKRKRKDKGSESEEGFSVFKTSEVAASVDVKKEKKKDKEIREKKEFNRQIQRDALLRKKHGI